MAVGACSAILANRTSRVQQTKVASGAKEQREGFELSFAPALTSQLVAPLKSLILCYRTAQQPSASNATPSDGLRLAEQGRDPGPSSQLRSHSPRRVPVRPSKRQELPFHGHARPEEHHVRLAAAAAPLSLELTALVVLLAGTSRAMTTDTIRFRGLNREGSRSSITDWRAARSRSRRWMRIAWCRRWRISSVRSIASLYAILS